MGFKYINPGYANLLDTDKGITLEGEQYNPDNKVAFWQPDAEEGISLEEIPKELYGKFDVYLSADVTGSDLFYVKVGISPLLGIRIYLWNNTWRAGMYELRNGSTSEYFEAYCSAQSSSLANDTGIVMGAVNTVYFHIKVSSNRNTKDGLVEMWINEKCIGSCAAYMDSVLKSKIVISSDSEKALLSNIILSDEEIARKERIIEVPALSVETDMKDNGDGSYTADKAGQIFLQKIDAEKFIGQYGGDSQILGVACVGNPGYRTADGLSKVISISRSGDEITEYNSQTLKTGEGAAITVGRKVSMSLADLVKMELGWKAGT